MKNKFIMITVLFLIIFLGLFFIPKGFNDKCKNLPTNEKPSCWKLEFENTVRKKGIEEGFELLSNLYTSDTDFAATCHDYTHLIGEEAYKRFLKKEKFNLSDTSSYCGYGFYHGFIISLFKEGEGKEEASNFCKYADDLLSHSTRTVVLDCFHGIGHGATDFNTESIKNLSDLNLVVNNSLKICSDISDKKEEKERCVDGVYHSVLDTSISNEKVIGIFKQNGPFSFCNAQLRENRYSCFTSLGFLVMYLNENDFDKSLVQVQSSLSSNYAEPLIRQMAGFEAYRIVGKGEFSGDLLSCKKIAINLKEQCIKGLVEGATDFGEPGKEEDGIIKMCNNTILDLEEQELCLKHATIYFEAYFGGEKSKNFCNLVGERYCDYMALKDKYGQNN